MKTIPCFTLHITQREMNPLFVKNLFDLLLREDSSFHFFYEPDFIIRISSLPVLTELEMMLGEHGYSFVSYDYPLPDQQLSIRPLFGEAPGGIVMENLENFTRIFHLHAKTSCLFEKEMADYYISETIKCIIDESRCTHDELYEMFSYLSERKAEENEIVTEEPFRFVLKPSNLSVVAGQLLSDLEEAIRDGLRAIRTKGQGREYELAYFERVIHTLFNMHGFSRQDEADYLCAVAEFHQLPRTKCCCFVL